MLHRGTTWDLCPHILGPLTLWKSYDYPTFHTDRSCLWKMNPQLEPKRAVDAQEGTERDIHF